NGGTSLYLDAMGVAGGRKWRWIAGTAAQLYGVGNGFGLFDDTAVAYRIAVAPSGNVGIGTTGAAYKLEVNGTVAGVGPYQELSDLRYKKNIATLTDALQKVKQIRGVKFDWRAAEFPTLNFNAGRQAGFI